jgi:hypothetical protein
LVAVLEAATPLWEVEDSCSNDEDDGAGESTSGVNQCIQQQTASHHPKRGKAGGATTKETRDNDNEINQETGRGELSAFNNAWALEQLC